MQTRAVSGFLAVPVFLTLLAGACRTNGPSSHAEFEVELQSRARSVVRMEHFTLYSPYDEALTATFVPVLEAEDQLVRDLFEDHNGPPVPIHLMPLEADSDALEQESWREVSHDGVLAMASDAGFVVKYVRADAGQGLGPFQAGFSSRTLRHELAHVHARRVGLARPCWYNEGLASEVEHMRAGEGGLGPHEFPPGLVGARARAHAGAVARLLGWKRMGQRSIEEYSRLYEDAQALVRFLVERQEHGTWLERARTVLQLDDQSIAGLEQEWLAWLHRLDALDAIRRGTRSGDARERKECASLLPKLAAAGAQELFTPAADALALSLLTDPSTRSHAATFLLFFRAKDMAEADVAGLVRSEDPAHCLTGIALRARRGEAVDAERARAAWERLPKAEFSPPPDEFLVLRAILE